MIRLLPVVLTMRRVDHRAVEDAFGEWVYMFFAKRGDAQDSGE